MTAFGVEVLGSVGEAFARFGALEDLGVSLDAEGAGNDPGALTFEGEVSVDAFGGCMIWSSTAEETVNWRGWCDATSPKLHREIP